MEYKQFLGHYNINSISHARQSLLNDTYKNILKYKCMLGIADPLIQDAYNECELLRNQLKEKEDKENKLNVCFITISPDPKIVGEYADVNQYLQIMKKITNYKWMKRWVYVLEQRGDTEATQGKLIHIHLLFFLDGKKPSHAIREVERNVKHLCDTSHSSVFNVRRCKDDDENVLRLANYITGRKKDEHKHAKQEVDKLWRNNNNILPFYQNNFLDYIIEQENATQNEEIQKETH